MRRIKWALDHPYALMCGAARDVWLVHDAARDAEYVMQRVMQSVQLA